MREVGWCPGPELNRHALIATLLSSVSEWIVTLCMLRCDPVVGCKLLDDPITAEPADAAVLLAAKRTGRGVIDRRIIDMSHPRLDGERESQSSRLVATEDG